ncbi:MAG: hypothetical protein ACO1O6_08240 [Bacteroidota bacterium]
MKTRIIKNAKEDIPLYLKDFITFWDSSLTEISDENLYKTYRATLVFKNWKTALNSIKIKEFDLILNELFEDINSSFFLAFMGQYRSAHMHMRSSIELTLQLLYFYNHPIEFQKWKKGEFVIKTDKLNDYLVQHPYFKVDVSKLLQNINNNWKHFSKHIHGESPIFFQCEKDIRKTNSFSKKDFGIWKSNFEKNVYFLNKLLYLFFNEEFIRFPEVSRNILLDLIEKEK